MSNPITQEGHPPTKHRRIDTRLGEYVSVKELAAMLNKDPKTVWRWHKQHGLPLHRFGRELHGSIPEVRDWLAAARVVVLRDGSRRRRAR